MIFKLSDQFHIEISEYGVDIGIQTLHFNNGKEIRLLRGELLIPKQHFKQVAESIFRYFKLLPLK